MKLSEAIRAGAKLGPQSYTSLDKKRQPSFWRWLLRLKPVTEFCALGGAFELVGAATVRKVLDEGHRATPFRGEAVAAMAGESVTVVEYPNEWDVTMERLAICPFCNDSYQPLYRLIPHLNDVHKVTREDIAGFVAQKEFELGTGITCPSWATSFRWRWQIPKSEVWRSWGGRCRACWTTA